MNLIRNLHPSNKCKTPLKINTTFCSQYKSTIIYRYDFTLTKLHFWSLTLAPILHLVLDNLIHKFNLSIS